MLAYPLGVIVSHVEIMASLQAPVAFQHEATEESSGAMSFYRFHCQVGNFYGRKVGREARNMEISPVSPRIGSFRKLGQQKSQIIQLLAEMLALKQIEAMRNWGIPNLGTPNWMFTKTP